MNKFYIPLLAIYYYTYRNVKTNMSRTVTTISILESVKLEATKAAKEGKYPGTSTFSGLVEVALNRLLHPENYPIEHVSPEEVAEV